MEDEASSNGVDAAPVIPFEVVDEEEMKAIEAAFSFAAFIPPPVLHPGGVADCPPASCSVPPTSRYFLRSCTNKRKPAPCSNEQKVHTRRGADALVDLAVGSVQHALEEIERQAVPNKLQFTATIQDIEETGPSKLEETANEIRKRRRARNTTADVSSNSRKECRSLCVTDVTALEWCEKQVEFTMTRGKPEKTFAMKAGSARHLELEIEISTKVEVEVQSKEDSWAIRMVNFIIGTRQLYAEGLTRELPVLGLLESTWLVGVIDELRMCDMGGVQCPLLVDTKTRLRPSPPSEAQKRNARLQLMCYKLIWDTMTQKGISSEIFYECFDLRPHQPLSESVKCHVDGLAMHLRVCNFEDVVQLFNEECLLLPSCHSSLLLRYEWQADQSILGEDEFPFELEWCTDRLKWHLEYWQGQRPATFVADDEHWKCNFCSFAGVCPAVNASVEEQTTCN